MSLMMPKMPVRKRVDEREVKPAEAKITGASEWLLVVCSSRFMVGRMRCRDREGKGREERGERLTVIQRV